MTCFSNSGAEQVRAVSARTRIMAVQASHDDTLADTDVHELNCLPSMQRKALTFAGFVALSFLALISVQPKPDLITIDFAGLASSFSGLLTALGGFSITVLAVLLGLEALDFEVDNGDPVAHSAAVRHVAVSLAVACITCFVGANLMAEVSAQSEAIDRNRTVVANDLALRLQSQSVGQDKVAKVQQELTQPNRPNTFFPQSHVEQSVTALVPKVSSETRAAAQRADENYGSSGRRLFLVSSLSAFLSSVVILQALSFLLRIRFPRTNAFTNLQNFAVLGITLVLLVKVVHNASYGLQGTDFVASRLLFVSLLAIVGFTYMVKTRSTIKRLTTQPDKLENYTPLLPYYASLGATILCAGWLAATFSNYGQPSVFDRALVIGGAALCTALFLVIQLEQPTIELLLQSRRAD